MRLVFKSGSIEKFLTVFIEERRAELPQHVIIDVAGSGAYYQALGHLRSLGLVEETRCFSEEKQMVVKCVRLTEKGRQVVEHLREIRRIALGDADAA